MQIQFTVWQEIIKQIDVSDDVFSVPFNGQ